jgi:UDP-2,3-diacylglucosamine hydrolase
MRIGMIAGSGQFPILFSQKAQLNGYLVYAAAIVKEANPLIESHVESLQWVHLGQVQKIVSHFRACRIDKAVMLGAVDKTRMFADARPDAKAIAILAGMKHTHDDALLRAFADAFKEEGIEIVPSTLFLPELLAPKGCWTKRKPTADENADIRIGYTVAKAIGSLDIGQSVVVGGGSVLAVEAIDGTDATIKRGGRLGRGRSVVVKTSKPGQDLRFDVPAAGVETICAMQEAGISALAVEAGKTVVFDREEMTALADQYGMTVVALDDDFSDQPLMKQR